MNLTNTINTENDIINFATSVLVGTPSDELHAFSAHLLLHNKLIIYVMWVFLILVMYSTRYLLCTLYPQITIRTAYYWYRNITLILESALTFSSFFDQMYNIKITVMFVVPWIRDIDVYLLYEG